jgi:hypothetical protein
VEIGRSGIARVSHDPGSLAIPLTGKISSCPVLLSYDEIPWPVLGAASRSFLKNLGSQEAEFATPLGPWGALLVENRFAALSADVQGIFGSTRLALVSPPVRDLAIAFSVFNRDVRKGGPHGGAEAWEAVQRLLLDAQTKLQAAGAVPRRPHGLEVDPAEVVTAYCGGWRGPGRGLDARSADDGARAALLWVVTYLVHSTSKALATHWGVTGVLDDEDLGPDARRVDRLQCYWGNAQLLLVQLLGTCGCEGPTKECKRADHSLRSWDPARETLWSFLRRAISGPPRKGGSVRNVGPPPVGSFSKSMLGRRLQAEGHVTFCTIEMWQCPERGLFQGPNCPRCGAPADASTMKRVANKNGYIPKEFAHRYHEVKRRACTVCDHLADISQERDSSCEHCHGVKTLSQRPTRVWTRAPH